MSRVAQGWLISLNNVFDASYRARLVLLHNVTDVVVAMSSIASFSGCHVVHSHEGIDTISNLHITKFICVYNATSCTFPYLIVFPEIPSLQFALPRQQSPSTVLCFRGCFLSLPSLWFRVTAYGYTISEQCLGKYSRLATRMRHRHRR